MQKIIRYLLIGIGILVVVPVVAVVIFVAVFDANAYKQDLSNVVLEQTGRDLQFQGDVSLTIFPSLGMTLGGMSFANAPGFGELPMMRIGEASVSVDVMSLLRLTPEIDKLILRDFEINLMRNKVGVNNWDDLVQKQGVAPSTGSSSGSTSGSSAQLSADSKASSPASSNFELKGAFAGLEIENLKLLWLDEQAGERYQITDLDISTGRIAPNESFPLTMHLDASGSGDVDVVFDLEANVEYLIEQQRLTLNEMILALNEFEIGGMVQVSNFAKPALRFDLASELLDVDALLGTPPASKAESADTGPTPAGSSGDASSDGSGGTPDEDVQIALPMQALRDLDIDGKLKIAKMKAQNLHMNDFDMRLTAQKGLVALKPVSLKMYDGEVTVNLAVDVTGKHTVVDHAADRQ
jgi:AsmA protein